MNSKTLSRLLALTIGISFFAHSLTVSFGENYQMEQVYCSKHAHFLAPIDAPDHRKYAPSRIIDILHVQLNVTPDFKRRTVHGSTTIRFKPIAKAIDQLRLDAVGLDFSDITSSAEIDSWHVSEDAVIVDFKSPLPAESEHTVVLNHAAEPEKGMYFRTPEMGYQEGEAHLFTQGEPVEARHWFPCFDAPNEKFTSEITCHVPSSMVVLSNGRLVSQEHDSETGLTSFTWLQDTPHVNYLISLVAGHFVKIEDPYRDIPMAFWTLPSEIDQAENSFKDTKAMMEFFEEEIGVTYPWAKYDQVCVNDFVAGGMENTSLTSLTDRTLFTSDTENLRSSQGLVAHELAHQWFGDLVTCKDWSHLWLNEGFATYYDALFEEHKHGKDAFLYQMYRNAKGFIGQHSDQTPIVDRTYNDPMNQFGYRAYPKGSWILHMLRSQLGKDLYRKCVQTYLERHAYGVVVTENLNAVIEELSGRSYDRFFDQYVFHGGHPDLSLSYQWDSKLKLAKITAKQNQKISDKVMLFQIPATIRFKTGATITDHPVTLRKKSEDFYIPLDAAPEIVRFDPDFTILAKVNFSKPTPLVMAQLEDQSDVIGRILAIQALSKNKSQKTIDALRQCLASDPFHGVRMEAADALKSIHTEEALDALLESSVQSDARVRLRVQSAIGGFYNPRALESAMKTIRSESNPTIINTAMRSLSGYGNSGIDSILLQYLREPSYRNTHAESAIAAMEKQDNPVFIMPILETLMERKGLFSTRGMVNALSSLAYLGRHQDDKSMLLSFIAGRLQDPKSAVRSGAIRALATLRDPKAIAILEKWMSADSDSPEYKAAQTAISNLRKMALPGEDLKGLRNKIQTMESDQKLMHTNLNDLKKKMEALSTRPVPKETSAEKVSE
ncbi:MAG: M1 family metallopeptidase [Verrucomicrobia bacterium]|nr:M1 family metallopeptidase [Verrucomicrobiota bacterium]MBT4277100.1 M1 family metallopeptidase [Verrucomicrobiota bacterium]MBT5477917.1 M1 family metallopeptidase [Verrucomicrobiota bacterium]MBT7536719.1 M1 family metallopeptidase [Verrucomicrobiota bacterium]